MTGTLGGTELVSSGGETPFVYIAMIYIGRMQ